MDLLHLIDIGNTSATYATASKGRILASGPIEIDKIPEKIKKKAKSGLKNKNIVIISSVVPNLTDFIVSEINARGSFEVLILGKDIQIPLRSKYKKSKKLGIDRKINAYGAITSHKTPCLVFDFGTALTCDLIDENGVFLGGLIIPGPATSLRSLLHHTALLPKVFQLKKESGRPYGRNTHECLQHGIIQAYAAMTDGLIAKLSREFRRKPHVIITGGFSSFIGKIMGSKAEINPRHTVEAMLKLYLAKKGK